MLRNMDDISETCGSFFLVLLLVFTFGGADDHQLTWEICWIPDGGGDVDAGDMFVHTYDTFAGAGLTLVPALCLQAYRKM